MDRHASRLASSSALTHLQKALASSLTAPAAGIAHENKANHTGRNRCPEVGSCRLSLISQISDLTCPDSLPPLPVSPSLARPVCFFFLSISPRPISRALSTGGAQSALETASAPDGCSKQSSALLPRPPRLVVNYASRLRIRGACSTYLPRPQMTCVPNAVIAAFGTDLSLTVFHPPSAAWGSASPDKAR
ncbi:hypothetical protein FB107DRAFT_260393, partial [Schizophyllum commune]